MTTLARKLMDAPAADGIQFVGSAISARAGSTSGTVTLSLTGLTGGIAAAAASGDFILAAFGSSAASNVDLSITDGTSDYTSVANLYANDSRDTNLQVSYKFSTGDTTTTFGPTGGASQDGVIAVYVFRGVNATTPMDVTATTVETLNTLAADPPTITPSTSGAYIVAVGAAGHRGGSGTYSSSDLTDFIQHNTNAASDRCTLGIGQKTDWTSGAFDPAAFGITGFSDSTAYSYAAVTMALRPA